MFARSPRLGLRLLFGTLGIVLAGCGGGGPVELPARVLVVAVEGLSVEQVDRMVADDELPVLGRMIARGARAEVLAPDPLDPAMLWATALTGQSPRTHEMMGELVNLPSGQRSLPPSSMRQSKTFLQIASDAGHTVVGVGLPTTWPAEVHNGVLVAPPFVPTRWTETTEHSFDQWLPEMNVYPLEVASDLESLIQPRMAIARETASSLFKLNEAEYAMFYDEPLGSLYQLENPLADVAITLQRDASFVDMTIWLGERYSPSLAAVHLELLEPVQRAYWPFQRPELYTTPADSRRRYRHTVREAYQIVDQQIGDLIASLPERSTVIVVGARGYGDAPDVTNPDSNAPVPQSLNRSLMVLWGHGIESGVDLGTVALADVTPTVLALSGIHLGSDMAGGVLNSAIDDAFEAAHPRRTVPSHDENWDQTARYPASAGHDAPVDDASETP